MKNLQKPLLNSLKINNNFFLKKFCRKVLIANSNCLILFPFNIKFATAMGPSCRKFPKTMDLVYNKISITF